MLIINRGGLFAGLRLAEYVASQSLSLAELLEDLNEVNPVLRRMLENEVRIDLDMWERRIKSVLLRGPSAEDEGDQEDLFSPPG